jgi:hypothetical protein|tara:strand:- start:9459 stop:10136 length:678 start_codon:yes stop_codon:yes gene_type:complete
MISQGLTMALQSVSIRSFCSLFFRTFLVQNSRTSIRKVFPITCLILAIFSPSLIASEVPSIPEFLRGSIYEDVGNEKGVDPALLYAVALTESGRALGERSEAVAPWPYVLRAADARFYADNEDDYRLAYKLFVKKYGDKFDVGPLQVNVYWQVTRGKRTAAGEDLLDFRTNLSVGADTLKDAMASTNDKALGIGRYHTWSDNDRARLFGERVLAVHQNLMESTKQ